METTSIIYIDHFTDSDDFAKKLVSQIKMINDDIKIITLKDLKESNQEKRSIIPLVLKAINSSDVTISIIDNNYISSVNDREEIKTAIKSIQSSENRYYFPIIYSQSNWLNTDWLVKAKLYPSNSSIRDLTDNESDKEINKLLENLKIILSKKESNKPKTKEKTTSKKNKIFISHSGIDSDFAELLQYKLKENGYSSWLDTDELKIGQDWREEIDKGIENSLAIIVIVSPEASKSEYVTYEWAYASGLKKIILPILLRKTQIHPKLELLQYLDFTNSRARPYDELLDKIANIK